MPRFTQATTLERDEATETGVGAPVSSLPPEVLALLQDMSGKISDLADQVKEIKAEKNPFRPMNHLGQPGAVEKLQIPKDGTPFFDPRQGKQMPQGSSFALTPELMAAHPKRFRIGSRVTLNLDTSRGHVRTDMVMQTIERKDRDGKPFTDVKEVKEFTEITWREVVGRLPQIHCPSAPVDDWRCPGIMTPGESCPSCGWAARVARVEFMNARGQWVYKVNFPGISSGAREQAFEDYELVSA